MSIILEGVVGRLRKQEPKTGEATRWTWRRLPVLESKAPGSLKLGEEGVYEYIPFP
jgi:hypothetical protein